MSAKDYLYPPDISPQLMKLIEMMRMQFLEHPDYFEHSPYPQEVERAFKSWFHTPIKDEGGTYDSQTERDLSGDDQYSAMYRETVELYAQLKRAKPAGQDSSESMAYFRTVTQLQDKLLTYQERAVGIRTVHEFHKVVMEVMENTLTEEQREEAMKRLKDAIRSN